ncbi:MAG: UDP-galactopyranose mutase [Hyphomicrobium sp.]
MADRVRALEQAGDWRASASRFARVVLRTLVVGAGFTGSVLAERIATVLGKHVLVIDRRDHIGGNAFDYHDRHGVLIHKYGPHIFHTNSMRIANYLSGFTSWRPYEHRVMGWLNEQFVPLPFNLTSMEILFGNSEGGRLNKLLTDEFGIEVKVPILAMRQSKSPDVRRIADVIYEKVFLHYTKKQWGLTPEELDPAVSARVPVHLSRDDRYFQDSFQKMPSEGFATLFDRMLDHPLIEVRLGVSLKNIDGIEKLERVIFTGPIDEFFSGSHGSLPYRSIKFDFETTASEELVQSVATQNYPTEASQHAYTRSTEFRFLTGQSGVGYTTRVFEYPENYIPETNEPYYPVLREENRNTYRAYEAEAKKLKTVVFAGRLADYTYYNMDQAVGRALSCFEKQIAPSAA